MRITIVADNVAGPRGLLAEHGLSLWIEAGGQRVLFDTGQGLVLRHNADALGLRLGAVDSVVLSHGHYDHTGGLAAVLASRSGVPVYAQPEALGVRYSGRGTLAREIGMPGPVQQALLERADFRASRAPTQVRGGLQLTGAIPRRSGSPSDAGRFFRDAQGHEPDPIADDQAAFIETREGVVVILGCGHAGLVNTLLHVESITGGRVSAVLGGMHLGNADDRQIEAAVRALLERDVERVVPCHCTGLSATLALVQAFGPRCSAGRVGAVHEFEP